LEARPAGIDDSISKPFRIHELMPKIEALVNEYDPTLIITPSIGLG
jgi:DNA-binding response OmpR family regulator